MNDLPESLKIEIERKTYFEIMSTLNTYCKIVENEGIEVNSTYGLIKCLRGILKKQCGITVNFNKYGILKVKKGKQNGSKN